MAHDRFRDLVLTRVVAVAAAATFLVWPLSLARADDLLVFAAASTRESIEAVSAIHAGRSKDTVRTVFAATSALARQIDSGAPADVFISANRRWMDWLARRQRIVTDSRRDLFGNRLVLVVPRSDARTIAIEAGFPLARLLGDGRLAVADPDHVPAGIYARQALEALGVWDAVGRRAARARDVRGALALVERGEAPAGVVYATDARISARVRVAGTFPQDSHAPITYAGAIVRGRGRAAVARFFDFLISAEARAEFARRGFIVD